MKCRAVVLNPMIGFERSTGRYISQDSTIRVLNVFNMNACIIRKYCPIARECSLHGMGAIDRTVTVDRVAQQDGACDYKELHE